MTSNRMFELTLTLVAIILLSPLLGWLTVLVRFKMGSPVLFRQVRTGLYGKPFTIYKFRTMAEARDAVGNLLPDSRRVCKLGRFLRSTSLDELPELVNVLKGDMKLVGPRPLLIEYLGRYSPEQARRHEVKPGITGWAQVNGRNAISWEEKFKLDVWYVDNWSLWLDIKILLITMAKVIMREGINEKGERTMSEFLGNITDR